jgi:hypothetical protein
MKTQLPKAALVLLLACLCSFSCSVSSDSTKARWRIQTVEYATGTNYGIVVKQTFLFDTQTGRTWSLNSDPTNGYYVWIQCVFRDQVGRSVTP